MVALQSDSRRQTMASLRKPREMGQVPKIQPKEIGKATEYQVKDEKVVEQQGLAIGGCYQRWPL
jgi:hypothetical protein